MAAELVAPCVAVGSYLLLFATGWWFLNYSLYQLEEKSKTVQVGPGRDALHQCRYCGRNQSS